MKTSELEGAKLDYWVALAAQIKENDGRLDIPAHLADCAGQSKYFSLEREQWRPSALWQHGGPIIERERITVQASQAGDWRAFSGDGTTNAGTARGPREAIPQARGDTPLIAAMRAFVASKLGEEVPDA